VEIKKCQGELKSDSDVIYIRNIIREQHTCKKCTLVKTTMEARLDQTHVFYIE